VTQFTAEHRDGEHYTYDLETILTLKKATGKVHCDLPGLATLAQEALDEWIVMRNGSDVTQIIQGLFERQADRHSRARTATGRFSGCAKSD
jgi:hypothetical protein